MRAARLTGERKPVTALFADVVGSTSLAEQMDPEDWTAIINEAFDLMSQAVFRYEGTIAQLQGDAMLAFFGAPVAHEDDPDRAVLAALDMVAGDRASSPRQLQGDAAASTSRSGPGSTPGRSSSATSARDLRYEYTALGDAMNVAARMQTAAEPGSVLVTASTHRLVGDAFEIEDLGGIEVKGKAEPVHAYRVHGRKAAACSAARPRAVPASRARWSGGTGRSGSARAASTPSEAGRGRVAFVVGEPGIGKSRLLAELRGTS